MSKTHKWLFTVPGKKKWYVVILVLIHSISGASGVLYALLLRSIVDSAVAKEVSLFWRNVVLIGLLILGQLALNAIARWLNMLARSDIENIFKKRLTDNILKKNYAAVSSIHTAEWLNRLTSDTSVVAKAYTEILPGLAGMIVRLFSALIMVIALDSWFAFILIPGGIVLIGLTYAFRGKLKALHKSIQEKDGKLRIFLQEHFGSLIIVKSFSAEEQTSEQADERMREHKAARMKRNRFSNFSSFGMGMAMHGMYIIGVVYCAYGIMTGAVSYGTLTAVMQLIGQLQAPFANISGYLPRYYAMLSSSERLMEIEDLPDDLSGDAKTQEQVDHYYENELASFGLRNAHFTYRPISNDPDLSGDNMPVVLDGINIEIRKGEYIAFTGHSGCGKSTVLKLLMSMYELDSGESYMLSSDGSETLLSPEWRRLFAYIPQGNQLLSGTVRSIVSFADPDAAQDNERLIKALRIACADDFLDELSSGLDTLLGERGTGLSEGQMQRLAIARAIFCDNPVLLLDEATSALDEQTEKRVLTNLRRLTDKTVIIVTHRPAALSICNRVLRFTENGIEEQSRPA